jgi:endonuclease-3
MANKPTPPAAATNRSAAKTPASGKAGKSKAARAPSKAAAGKSKTAKETSRVKATKAPSKSAAGTSSKAVAKTPSKAAKAAGSPAATKSPSVDWPRAIKPLLHKYEGKRHPLIYDNVYQLLVLVVLSAQSSDDRINEMSPAFFKAFPNLSSLDGIQPEVLYPYIKSVRNFGNKADWLVKIAQRLKKDSNIPQDLAGLTELPGIGRKSANVILREAGKPAEGVIVDIHVLRVAPRLGIATGDDPKKIEQQLMDILPQSEWDAGMAMSFLGREICHPKPECEICLMKTVCAYYHTIQKIPAPAVRKVAATTNGKKSGRK